MLVYAENGFTDLGVYEKNLQYAGNDSAVLALDRLKKGFLVFRDFFRRYGGDSGHEISLLMDGGMDDGPSVARARFLGG